MTTQTYKNRLLKEINKFILEEDLIALAKAQILIEEVLKKEGFPFGDYKDKFTPYPFQASE